MSVYPWDEDAITSLGRSRVNHPIVLIRGVDITADRQFGTPVPPEQYNNPLRNGLRGLRPNIDLQVWWASLNEDASPVIHNVLNFITTRFHPASKIIIYGFSAGAYNALQVCRALNDLRYDYGARMLAPDPGAPPSEEHPRLVVDLLLTVDAVKNQLPREVQGRILWGRHVPECVRWNVNYYQKFDDPDEGGQGAILEPSRANQILQRSISHVRHGEMNDVVTPWIIQAAQLVLSNQPPVLGR